MRIYLLLACTLLAVLLNASEKPNIILVMADDQGWGQTSYNNHPILKTPNLDAMAANGLRFNRFYASAPVCSPTRSSVLTGRVSDRTAVFAHGYALRREEVTVAQILKKAGYATGHFGKWHLDGLRGPGVPVLADDPHSPGAFGFDEWLTVTNFFDMDPLMGRQGKFEEFKGDSSEVIVAEALKFIVQQKQAGKPFLALIWYGSPHDPFIASEADKKPFAQLGQQAQAHYGELVAMDRSIGTLRVALREMNIAENTLLWFNSDNGGLEIEKVEVDANGGLRGHKRTMWEGGLRVPGIIEWPAQIKGRITDYPAGCIDILPTLMDIVAVSGGTAKMDGISLKPLFEKELERRHKALPFHYHKSSAALIDNQYKLIQHKLDKDKYELYDLSVDARERNNIFTEKTEVAQRLMKQLNAFTASVAKSIAGEDYPGGIKYPQAKRQFWYESGHYSDYLDIFWKRDEYKSMKTRYQQGSKKP
ncbi:MAG: sulfatase-like hydrolase/transferase [Lentisphaeraceae bacterium]|nr:sulfatase-like hydrolase/transferase [Lentisphaeraceae bacterium]